MKAKHLFTIAVCLVASICCFSQTTITGNRVIAKDALYVVNNWLDSIQRSGSFISNRTVPTSQAVADYVKGKIGAIQLNDSMYKIGSDTIVIRANGINMATGNLSANGSHVHNFHGYNQLLDSLGDYYVISKGSKFGFKQRSGIALLANQTTTMLISSATLNKDGNDSVSNSIVTDPFNNGITIRSINTATGNPQAQLKMLNVNGSDLHSRVELTADSVFIRSLPASIADSVFVPGPYSAGNMNVLRKVPKSAIATATNPAGSDGQIQFNNNGSFGADSRLKYTQFGGFLSNGNSTLGDNGYLSLFNANGTTVQLYMSNSNGDNGTLEVSGPVDPHTGRFSMNALKDILLSAPDSIRITATPAATADSALGVVNFQNDFGVKSNKVVKFPKPTNYTIGGGLTNTAGVITPGGLLNPTYSMMFQQNTTNPLYGNASIAMYDASYPQISLGFYKPGAPTSGIDIYPEGQLDISLGGAAAGPNKTIRLINGGISFLYGGTRAAWRDDGSIKFDYLAGSGTRMVVVNDSGTISTQAVDGPKVKFVQTVTTNVTATDAETTLIGSGTGSLTIPAGTMTAGKAYRLTVRGKTSTDGSGPAQMNWRLYIGSTVVLASGNAGLGTNRADKGYSITADILCLSSGSTGTVMGQGMFNTEDGPGAKNMMPPNFPLSTSIDMTVNQAVNFTVDMTDGSAGNSCYAYVLIFEEI
jgi:hypothetical protein